MVTHWGMSEKVGPMAFRVGEEHTFLGKEIQEARDFSEGTAQVIDEEVSQILRDADRKATDLLTTNRNYLDAVTKELAHREELLRTEIEDVLRANGMDIPAEKPKQDAASEIAPSSMSRRASAVGSDSTTSA